MSIDNRIWVPAGARNNQNVGDTRYKSGDNSPSESYARHQVALTHGTNLLIDERYLFEEEMDARWFWEEGYKERLFKSDSRDETCGYDRMTLWLNGELEAERNCCDQVDIGKSFQPD
jgi:hypothetical protein